MREANSRAHRERKQDRAAPRLDVDEVHCRQGLHRLADRASTHLHLLHQLELGGQLAPGKKVALLDQIDQLPDELLGEGRALCCLKSVDRRVGSFVRQSDVRLIRSHGPFLSKDSDQDSP